MPFLLYRTLVKCNLGFPKILLYLLLLLSSNFYSQGVMAKVSGHHIAALDFLNTYTSTKNRISNPNPTTCGLTNTADNWYKENNISVKGLLSGAILVTDWWLLFNEPTENYNFQWKSSGKYQIEYFNKDGKQVFTTISKEMLSKYPDLVKRFNALKPLDVKFQINWRIGGHTDDDKDKFKKSYKIMGDIGSAMPHVKSDFTTKINNGLLFEASGIEPLSVPGIRQGKGKDFFGLPENYNDQKFKEILAYWNISKGHVINNFAVTQMRWPVAEMKSIAEKFEAYEKGTELSPKDQIKKADSIPITNKTKGDDAFWGDVILEENDSLIDFFDHTNNRHGIKNVKGRVIIPAKFHRILFNSNKVYPIIASNGDLVVIYNRKGIEIENFNIAHDIQYDINALFKEDGYLLIQEKGGHNFNNTKIIVYNLTKKKIAFETTGAWSGLSEIAMGWSKRKNMKGIYFHHSKWENNYKMGYYYEIKNNNIELYYQIGYEGNTTKNHKTFLDK